MPKDSQNICDELKSTMVCREDGVKGKEHCFRQKTGSCKFNFTQECCRVPASPPDIQPLHLSLC